MLQQLATTDPFLLFWGEFTKCHFCVYCSILAVPPTIQSNQVQNLWKKGLRVLIVIHFGNSALRYSTMINACFYGHVCTICIIYLKPKLHRLNSPSEFLPEVLLLFTFLN